MPLVDAASFGRFVASMPPSLEPDLVKDDTVSTAFFNALRVGWTEEQVTSDAVACVGRGGGVGLIITRFRTLATRNPVVRTPAGPRDRYVPPEVPIIPSIWAEERRGLLREIQDNHVGPDDAEYMMKQLIAEQRAR